MNQRSYKATGINLKAMPMGETDRLVTVLTKEHGLIRAIAPGARKHKSRLGGRSGMFVVNDLLFAKGKSLDKLIQAETLQSFPGLSKNLAKLTTSQYLAELALAQALSDQPQEELYTLLLEHLGRIEAAAKPNILPCLAQATFHMLALAGVAPEVFRCCLSRSPLTAQLGNPDWQVGFSVSSGGAVDLAELERIKRDRLQEIQHIEQEWQEQRDLNRHEAVLSSGVQSADGQVSGVQESEATYAHQYSHSQHSQKNQTNTRWRAGLQSKVSQEVTRNLGIVGYLSAAELALMQQLSKPELVLTAQADARMSASLLSASLPASSQTTQLGPQFDSKSGTIRSPATSADSALADYTEESGPHLMWRHIEKFLRQYAQYQFDRPIRSAALIDTCFTSPTHAARARAYD